MLRAYAQLPRPVYFLCLGTFLNRAGTLVVPFMTIYLTTRLGLDVQYATAAIGLCGLGSLIGAAIGGHLADRIGRRKVMMMALFGGALTLFGLSMVSDPALFLGCVLVLACINDMYRPAASAMIADLVPPAARPQAFTLVYLSINLGFAFAPVIGGYLAKYSFTWLFYGDAATAALYGVLVFFLLRETLRRPSSALPESTAAAPLPAKHDSLLDGLRRVAADRPFFLFCVANWLLALVYTQSMSTFPLYMNSLGFSPEQYGRLIAVNGVMIVLFQIPFSAYLAGRDRGTVLAIGAILCGIGFGMKALISLEWQFAGAVVLWTLGEMSQVPMVSPIVADRAPLELRARYMGMVNMSFSAGSLLGAPLGGAILSHWGGKTLWTISIVVAWFAALIYALISRALRAPHAVAEDAPAAPVASSASHE